ncbi:MAG: hypothetical protein B7Y83_01235 [Flavobacteriales bacterium 32-34-25]|nr:MAG: hypothetical protein B7Y83_01235 [Flavobacteriales bacterium 32-34-25]
MKSIFLCGILFFSSLTIYAQEKGNEITKSEAPGTMVASDSSNYLLTLGLNLIDDGGPNFLPFNNLSFKTPFFIGAERRFKSNLSLAVSVSTNQLKIQSEIKSYVGVDVVGQFYFDDYIFNNKNIETFAGLGVGRYFLEDQGKTTFDVTGGGRYWFSDRFGVSLQAYGKVGLQYNDNIAYNHYQYNLGIVWRNGASKK